MGAAVTVVCKKSADWSLILDFLREVDPVDVTSPSGFVENMVDLLYRSVIRSKAADTKIKCEC